MFKKLKYAILSKIAKRKMKQMYGRDISIKTNDYDISIRFSKFDVIGQDGKVETKVKAEITTYEKDCEKLINHLLKKSC